MRTRVAVVGGGVSGLVAASLLSRGRQVTLFEARGQVGGHVNTRRVEVRGEVHDVDTGFIVFNHVNYPLFTRLLAQIGVKSRPAEMSFSVHCERTGLEYNGSTLRQLFVQRRNLLDPSFHRMLLDILRFNRRAPAAVRNGASGSTLGEYLRRGGYGPRLAEHYLVPMGSALWSLPRGKVLSMPAEFFVRFFEQHGMLSVNGRPEWRVVEGGSMRYVEKLISGLECDVRLGTPVEEVRRAGAEVRVNGEAFDHVVFACHSDEALAVLADASAAERSILGAFPFQSNEVVLHTDTSILPQRTEAWASWNYRIAGAPEEPVSVTYNMNRLQSLRAARTFCVTLNPRSSIDAAQILYRTEYRHPVHTLEGDRARERHAEISGVRKTHYCGAYWGFGFHEDGVRSAFRVARALEASGE